MKTSISALTIALSLVASGSFAVAHAQKATQPPQQREPTSVGEQVKIDLNDWRKAGFDTQSHDALSYDVFSADYQQRYAKYQQLRKSHGPHTARN